MRSSKRFRFVLLLAAAVGLALGCQSSAGKKEEGGGATAEMTPSPSIGPETAPVTIVEVSDFQ